MARALHVLPTMERLALCVALIACEAAPLQWQSKATFAAAYGCDAKRVVATKTGTHASYDVFDVRGCGQRQIYVCATDVGCVRPEAVPAGAGPAFTLPPTLVDQSPPPALPSHEEEGE